MPPNFHEKRQDRRRRARRRLALGIIAVILIITVGVLAQRIFKRKRPLEQTAPSVVEQPDTSPTAVTESSEGEAGDEMEGMAMPETEAAEETELWGPPEPFRRFSVKLQPGDTLGTALDEAGVDAQMAQQIIGTLKGVLDFRRIRAQDHFDLLATNEGKLLEFSYERGIDEIYTINTSSEKWFATKQKRAFQTVLSLVRGTVDATLFDAIAAAGERPDLIMGFVEIFAWAIDFSIFTRKGDSFQILCEKLYDKGEFKGYGRIYAAQYINAGQVYEATYFEAPDGFTGYFDEHGRNLRRAFLKAPLRFNAITSSFTFNRFHPVLKFRRPHLGVDYAAPTGTPIWAVADGIVTGAGWMGGSGRAVKLRHRNGIETSYSHLSRIGKGVKPGKPVKQKQIIGYVGMTGLSTGPHLHYGMKVGGRAVNPARINLPAGDPVPKKYLTLFAAERAQWQKELAARLAQPAVVPAAANVP